MDQILGKMSPKAIDWLVDALDSAIVESDNTYVQPEYQVTQDEVGVALWEIRQLIVKTMDGVDA